MGGNNNSGDEEGAKLPKVLKMIIYPFIIVPAQGEEDQSMNYCSLNAPAASVFHIHSSSNGTHRRGLGWIIALFPRLFSVSSPSSQYTGPGKLFAN